MLGGPVQHASPIAAIARRVTWATESSGNAGKQSGAVPPLATACRAGSGPQDLAVIREPAAQLVDPGLRIAVAGVRQSVRGESEPPEPTLGPFGMTDPRRSKFRPAAHKLETGSPNE